MQQIVEIFIATYNRPHFILDTIGVLSYSLYIWQQLFLVNNDLNFKFITDFFNL